MFFSRWAQVFLDGRKPLECGKGQRLILTNVTYNHQGQYLCIAWNKINGNIREIKSNAVYLQVFGAPRVIRTKMFKIIKIKMLYFKLQVFLVFVLQIVKPTNNEKFIVSTTEGNPAKLEIRLCSNPKPQLVAWEWGSTRLHAGKIHMFHFDSDYFCNEKL